MKTMWIHDSIMRGDRFTIIDGANTYQSAAMAFRSKQSDANIEFQMFDNLGRLKAGKANRFVETIPGMWRLPASN